MATEAQIASLRRMTNEPTVDTYSDASLNTIIDAAGGLDSAAALIWSEKAASYAGLVDVKEGSSSRSLGSLHNQALAMHKSYNDAANGTNGRAPRSRTRPIERA